MRGIVVALVGIAAPLACTPPPPTPVAEVICTATVDCPAGLECVGTTCTAPGAYAAAELARIAAERATGHAARPDELARLTAMHAALVATQRPLELEKLRIDANLRMATGEQRGRLMSEWLAVDVRLEELEDASEVGSIARKDRLERERQAILAALREELRAEEHMRLTAVQNMIERSLAAMAPPGAAK
jgi:hypothetical protein